MAYGYQPYYQPLYQQPYQPMQQPFPMQPNAQVQTPTAQTGSAINWVQGEEGAKAWMVQAGQSALLMDSEKPSFYIKSTEQSGMPMPLRIFDYTERTAATTTPTQSPPAASIDCVTREELNALSARVDSVSARIEAMTARKPGRAKETLKEETE